MPVTTKFQEKCVHLSINAATIQRDGIKQSTNGPGADLPKEQHAAALLPHIGHSPKIATQKTKNMIRELVHKKRN